MRERDLVVPSGLRLRVCEWGPAEGPATLILHGYLEQGAAWDAVASRLPGRIVAPDMRGHGRSGHVGEGAVYHFWDYVGDVDALVDDLGGPVDLVGHSMGGTVSCLFAAVRPDKVRRLALIEGLGPPDATEGALDRARQFLDDLRDPPKHAVMPDVAAAAGRMRRFNPKLPATTAHALALRSIVPTGGGVTWSWDARHRARSPVPFQMALFTRFLRAIRAPTLLVYGADSPYRMPDLPEREACLHEARRVVLPEAGHLPHHDCPEGLAHVLREHLETP